MPVVDYKANCGNCSSAVGPFAIDEGLVKAIDGETCVRIYNTNTHKLIVARVPVKDGEAAVEGDFELAGVSRDWARASRSTSSSRAAPAPDVSFPVERRARWSAV